MVGEKHSTVTAQDSASNHGSKTSFYRRENQSVFLRCSYSQPLGGLNHGRAKRPAVTQAGLQRMNTPVDRYNFEFVFGGLIRDLLQIKQLQKVKLFVT